MVPEDEFRLATMGPVASFALVGWKLRWRQHRGSVGM
jgi:hypothetical protein